MIIFRYLTKEVTLTLVALTSILLLIFMSNQFVLYLNRAANGSIPGMIILKLMLLEMPNLIGLLLPLGFYISLLIAYGRLYADSEMTVLQACGYSPNQLLKHSLIMATVLALIVGTIMIWAAPIISTERTKLLRAEGIQTLIKTIIPGRFRALSGGRDIFYVESMNRDHSEAENIFFARQTVKNEKTQWDILWANQAVLEKNPQDKEDYVVLKEGQEYQGFPGQANYQVSEFEQYKVRLPKPTIALSDDIRTFKTGELLPFLNPDKRKAAELQWRISMPIMVIVLTIIAVPLSRVNPRSGKFAKLLPAILIYFLYANLMFIFRNWIVADKIPQWLGLWSLHGLMLFLGFALITYNRVKLS